MRYYRVPGRPIIDPETGTVRATRVAYFDGGNTTRFIDPETGIEYPAVFVGQYRSGYPTDFRRPVAPSRAERIRAGRAVGIGTKYVPGQTRRTAG